MEQSFVYKSIFSEPITEPYLTSHGERAKPKWEEIASISKEYDGVSNAVGTVRLPRYHG